MCKIPVSQVTVSDSLSHTEPTMWFPLPIIPFALLLRETGLIYDHSICVYMFMSVCWSHSFCLNPQSLHQGLTKGQRKQILASSYKFCENRQGCDSIIILVEGEAGMCNPRERGESQQIPQPWEKFQLRLTVNHCTQIYRKVGMFNPTAQKTTHLARQAL